MCVCPRPRRALACHHIVEPEVLFATFISVLHAFSRHWFLSSVIRETHKLPHDQKAQVFNPVESVDISYIQRGWERKKTAFVFHSMVTSSVNPSNALRFYRWN